MVLTDLFIDEIVHLPDPTTVNGWELAMVARAGLGVQRAVGANEAPNDFRDMGLVSRIETHFESLGDQSSRIGISYSALLKLGSEQVRQAAQLAL